MKWLYCGINLCLILFFEMYLVNPVQYIVPYPIISVEHVVYAILSFCVSDLIAYCFHYFLHSNRFMYNHIHYLHHREILPTCQSTIYMHPVEISSFFFIYRLPLLVGIPFTQATFMGYQSLLIIWTLLDHTWNYSLFSDHFLHHRYFSGNYATCLQFWDSLFGTKLK